MNKFFKKMSKESKNKYTRYLGFKQPIKLYKAKTRLNKNVIHSSQALNDWDIWKNAFINLIHYNPKFEEVIESFILTDIVNLKYVTHFNNSSAPILICVVKDDLERIQLFYNHYRNIGIKHFVIIDNNSTDGTQEWVLKQPDTDVFLVEQEFSSQKKYGWINRILSIYGFNRWYLYADSDELFVYSDIENHNIIDLIHYAELFDYKRVSALLLDMYSDKGLFEADNEMEILNDYVFFDSDTYTFSENYITRKDIRGGPRMRTLKYEKNMKGPILIKHPLFYFEKDDVFHSAHRLFPLFKNTLFASALKHYKFLHSDYNRYKKIAENGTFANNSEEYKQYIKSFDHNNNLSFIYEQSKKYENSDSLKYIPNIKEIHWEKLKNNK